MSENFLVVLQVDLHRFSADNLPIELACFHSTFMIAEVDKCTRVLSPVSHYLATVNT